MTTATAALDQPDRTTAAPPITEADWFDREGYPFTSHYLRLPGWKQRDWSRGAPTLPIIATRSSP
jgi:hypothetical protein